MGKTVTLFSTEDKDSRVVERFTFEKLGIDEGMDDKAEKSNRRTFPKMGLA
ncbi:hypothetical protein OR571_03450 [Psychrobacillus sp. NEAU-3TGS]|uniref:hypothetical protein n=1 Tax=Psychrobacillus sp. NEAU-3TGS TaxID=2995412 RepID=UPI002498CCAD|nr:hypothetical protein [Psychrobacillus sp. NEAU-3TGS]MDI2586205.1 hypothetical protein [Psychrobacillus sp. NEAU-3TGS]